MPLGTDDGPKRRRIVIIVTRTSSALLECRNTRPLMDDTASGSDGMGTDGPIAFIPGPNYSKVTIFGENACDRMDKNPPPTRDTDDDDGTMSTTAVHSAPVSSPYSYHPHNGRRATRDAASSDDRRRCCRCHMYHVIANTIVDSPNGHTTCLTCFCTHVTSYYIDSDIEGMMLATRRSILQDLAGVFVSNLTIPLKIVYRPRASVVTCWTAKQLPVRLLPHAVLSTMPKCTRQPAVDTRRASIA